MLLLFACLFHFISFHFRIQLYEMVQNKSFQNHTTNNVKSTKVTKTEEWTINHLPQCQLPPEDEFSPVEHYVTVAITARADSANGPKSVISFSKLQVDPYQSYNTHEQGHGHGHGHGLDQNDIHSSNQMMEGNAKSMTSSSSSTSSYLSGYNAILDCIRKRNDPALLWKILLALRGHPLSIIASNPTVYDQLIHLIMKLDVFQPPKYASVSNDAITTTSTTTTTTTTTTTISMANDESNRYFTDYLLADAYLHFLVGLVSANSIFLIPCIETIWKNIIKDLNAFHQK